MTVGPLASLRVIDLTDDSGRFATKLLAECGASVIRIGKGSSGPPMRSAEAAERGGLLDWWYDGGKSQLEVDLDTEAGRAVYRRLADGADLIIDTEPPGRLESLGVDHADLIQTNPVLIQVSLTPFGRTGPRRDWQSSDLVAAALGGVLSVSGLPDQPVNAWGRQMFSFGGFYAAISGLAGVRAVRTSGIGQHVDLSLHEVVCSSIEHLFFQYWFDDVMPLPKIAPRQGSLHWIGAYLVVPANPGWVMITPSPNAGGLLQWMAEEGYPEAHALLALPLEEVFGDIPRVMRTVAGFAQTKDASSLFQAAQARKIAFGEVQSIAQVATNPQHEFRQFFRRVGWDGPEVRIPGPVAHFHGTPAPAPRPPGDTVSRVWEPTRPAEPGREQPGKPLAGTRVIDFTHVLAGPFATRILGDLGADILKLQTSERATLVNDPSYPYFYVWNRSRRSISLNMKDKRATDVARQLVESSDVLMENFSAGVLDRWGLSYNTVKEWNPRIIYVTMSGCGHEGPWSRLVTYAPTIHALCGLTYLSNPPGRADVGPGFSLNDHAAGMSAALSVLAALHARDETGHGQHVDISQMETGAYIVGPAILDYLVNGREAQPVGNADPFGHLCPNECYRTADGGWLAVTCRDDGEWARLVDATGVERRPELDTIDGRLERRAEVDCLVGRWAATVKADEGQIVLQSVGVPAGKIQSGDDLMADPQLLHRGMWRTFDHPVFGERPHDRYPAIWSGTTLEPYVPSPAYIGEHNLEVYPELTGLDESTVAEGIGDGLFS